MNILIVGAGAIGGYYGAQLARAGHAVTLLVRTANVPRLAREGLLLEAPGVHARVRLQATDTPAAARTAELVLICVKSGDTETVGEALRPHLADTATVMSFQNGADNAERLAAVLGRAVVATILYVAAERVAPDHVRHHGGGDVLIGASVSSERIAAVFREAGIGATVSEDIRAAQWDKLLINCGFNALSAIPQRPYGELVQRADVVALMRQAMQEGLAVARAAGIRTAFDPDAAIQRIAALMPEQRSSTAQDLAAGRRTEIDHLNGYVVRQGERLGIPTPVNRTLQVLVHLMEADGGGG